MSNFEALLKKYASKYKHPDMTRHDVLEALKRYRDLRPSLEPFVFNDGTTQHLVQLEGTIPVPYKGNTYNIPVQLWILDSHPYNPPMVYVRPTSTMQIKAGQYVDMNGKVDMPFLRDWRWPATNLLGLIDILIIKFGEECPVFSKVPARPPPPIPSQAPYNPTGTGQMPGMPQPGQPQPPPSYPGYPQHPPQPQPQPPQQMGGYPPMFPGYPQPRGFGPAASGGYPPLPVPIGLSTARYPQATQSSVQLPAGFGGYNGSTNPLPPPAYPAAATNQETAVSNTGVVRPAKVTGTVTEEHLRASMLSAVEDKLKRKLREFFAQAQAEMDVLKKTRADLVQGKEKLDRIVQDLEEEKVTLDNNTLVISRKDQEMTEALHRLESNENMNVDEAVVTTAPLYRQLLDAFAEEQAIEDAIYYLGEALRKNVIELEVFLKQVRELSRKQFMQRVLIQKCREKAGLPPLA